MLAEHFNVCLNKESCFPNCWKAPSVAPVFKGINEKSMVEPSYNGLADNLKKKCSLLSYFQYGLRSSC